MKDYLEHVVCGGSRSGFRTHLEFITNQVGEKMMLFCSNVIGIGPSYGFCV